MHGLEDEEHEQQEYKDEDFDVDWLTDIYGEALGQQTVEPNIEAQILAFEQSNTDEVHSADGAKDKDLDNSIATEDGHIQLEPGKKIDLWKKM